jgi:hypothetical protein
MVTTGSNTKPTLQAVRRGRGWGFAVRAVHRRPMAAMVRVIAPTGTTHAVREDRYREVLSEMRRNQKRPAQAARATP